MNLLSKSLLSALLSVVVLFSGYSQQNDWENPEMIGYNKLPAHNTSISFSGESEAMKGDIKSSSRFQSLNGNWKFAWAPVPEKAPEDFYKSKRYQNAFAQGPMALPSLGSTANNR